MLLRTPYLVFQTPLWEARKISRNEIFWAHYVAYRAAARVPNFPFPQAAFPPYSPP
jgi:hypothetical protein